MGLRIRAVHFERTTLICICMNSSAFMTRWSVSLFPGCCFCFSRCSKHTTTPSSTVCPEEQVWSVVSKNPASSLTCTHQSACEVVRPGKRFLNSEDQSGCFVLEEKKKLNYLSKERKKSHLISAYVSFFNMLVITSWFGLFYCRCKVSKQSKWVMNSRPC